jgi:hypothetical protein
MRQLEIDFGLTLIYFVEKTCEEERSDIYLFVCMEKHRIIENNADIFSIHNAMTTNSSAIPVMLRER